MNCLICKSNVIWGEKFDAEECGYDTKGVVETCLCSNEDCELFYEIIQLLLPENDESEDYYIYGENYVKFYKIDEY